MLITSSEHLLKLSYLLSVDASAAGSGDLDVEVSSNGHLVRIKRQPLGQSQYRYTYIPKQGGEHLIDVLYNSERVPGMHIISV